MKSRLFIFVVGIVVAIMLCAACGSERVDAVSERRSNYFCATENGITITAVSGVREDPYAADGRVGTLVPYTLITLVPDAFDIDAEYSFAAQTGNQTYGGAMIVHPFAASFSAEFPSETTTDFAIEIMCDGKATSFAMKSQINSEAIKYDRAIEAAKRALSPQGDYEIRVRIIKNPLTGDGLCWHVAFCTKDKTSSVLLDINSAKVLAKKS